MTVRKRGAHWHYDFRIDGKRYRGAIKKAKNKSDALTEEAKERAKILEGDFEKRQKPPTFAKFVETYIEWAKTNKRSWRQDESRAKCLIEFFGRLGLNQIKRFNIEQFKKKRLATETKRGDRSNATVNRELQLLSSILSLAIEDNYISSNPCRQVKKLEEDNDRTRFLTTEEEERLFDVLSDARFDRLRPVVIIALQTGIRRGALLRLEWNGLDFKQKLIRVRKKLSKTGKEYFVPMSETAFLVLQDLQIEYGARRSTVFGVKCIRRAWEKAVAKAKLDNFNFHDLRHTVGTRLDENGESQFVIKEILGHARIETTARYVHASDERKRGAVEKLNRRSQNGHKTKSELR